MLLGKTKKEYLYASIAFMFYFALTVTRSGKDHTRILPSELDIMIMMLQNIDAYWCLAF